MNYTGVRRAMVTVALAAAVVVVPPSKVTPRPQSSCTIDPQTVSIFDHRWPTENPLSYEEGCGGSQPKVSAVLGEYRTSPSHYHGGVDIPRPTGTPMYAVLQDRVWVDYVDDHEIGLAIHWSSGRESYYRYVHVTPAGDFDRDDEIVWNPSATGFYWEENHWKYPVHLPLCYVDGSGSPPHLHYEERWYDFDHGNWLPVNPLFWLCPWQDNDDPVVEGVDAFTGHGAEIVEGDGSYDDPWVVYDDFDLRVHAHDVLPSRPYNKAGIWQLVLSIRDEQGGAPVPDGQFGYFFSYLPHTSLLNDPKKGVDFTYDVSRSTLSDYYYWATNYFDPCDGGTNGAIPMRDLSLKGLQPDDEYGIAYNKKYAITLECCDFDWNCDEKTVWVERYTAPYPNPKCGPAECHSFSRGDMNLNHVCYDIGDAIFFTNYFIYGEPIWNPTYRDCQILMSDVNHDGIVLTVADLVYMIRIITGDAVPFPQDMRLSPYVHSAEVTYRIEKGTLRVSTTSPVDLGGALFVFRGKDLPPGQAVLAAAAGGMQIKSGVHDGELRVLVCPDLAHPGRIESGTHEIFSIPVVSGEAMELAEVQLADVHGAPVGANASAARPPQEYALLQNYPNPFNAGTVIPIDLKEPSDWSLVVYNVLGQAVRTLSGIGNPGRLQVAWDGCDRNGIPVPSGIYFYRVSAGDYNAARKMVVLK